MTIQLLPEHIILKIAAGEVIERPSSVVKELLENALDAKANSVTVSFSKDCIKILDDGKGMDKEDLELSYIRHATSKISSESDLFDVRTLGFRGEALASICAVSLVEITSKVADRETAYKIIIQGGQKISVSPASFPYDSGTEIVVKNLFYNTPARKKYLTSEKNELRLMIDVIEQYSLQTSSTIKVFNNNKLVLNSIKGSLKERYFAVYNLDAKEMIDIQETTSTSLTEAKQDFISRGLSVSGLISTPKLVKKSRSHQIVFVNNRLIKNSTIFAAVALAYKGYVNTGEHPHVVLTITIDPKKIDVNVHPTKQEIKFDDDSLLFKAVYHTIKETLLASDLTRSLSFDEYVVKKGLQKELEVESKMESSPKNFLNEKNSFSDTKTKPKSSSFSDQFILEDGFAKKQSEELSMVSSKFNDEYRVIGIFLKEFVILENIAKETLSILDFHAAAERIHYEKFTRQYSNNSVEKQVLLDPIMLELTSSDMLILEEYADFFQKLGYDFEIFGDTSIRVKTTPLLFGKLLDQSLFLHIISDLKSVGNSVTIDSLKDRIITMMSCKASERAGDDLTLKQAENILSELFRLFGNVYNCPHGRPTIIDFSKYDLEKFFKRIR